MNYTYDEILEMAERIDPRTELLKEGHNAIYFDENVNKDYVLRLEPSGKCYLIKFNDELNKSETIRELNEEEYQKLDLIKGKDY